MKAAHSLPCLFFLRTHMHACSSLLHPIPLPFPNPPPFHVPRRSLLAVPALVKAAHPLHKQGLVHRAHHAAAAARAIGPFRPGLRLGLYIRRHDPPSRGRAQAGEGRGLSGVRCACVCVGWMGMREFGRGRRRPQKMKWGRLRREGVDQAQQGTSLTPGTF